MHKICENITLSAKLIGIKYFPNLLKTLKHFKKTSKKITINFENFKHLRVTFLEQ